MDNLKVAVVQMTALDDFSYNISLMLSLLDSKDLSDVRIVFFPENCLYLRLDKKKLPPFLNLESEIFSPLKKWAKEHSISLHLGGVGITQDSKNYNASLFIDSKGVLSHTYSKQSLFDIDLPNGHSYKESDAYSAGSSNKILEFTNWRLGQSICYDLRFSAIYEKYRREGVDVLLIPSSFLVPTGKAHWHILNQARAIESQCYVISAAQVGDHKGKHQSYGHSLVIDPWGEVLLDLKDQANCIEKVSLSKKKIEEIRSQMPMSR